jgi:hypothetical protein
LLEARFDGCFYASLFLRRVLGVSWEFEARRVDGNPNSSLFLRRVLRTAWVFEARGVDGSPDSNLLLRRVLRTAWVFEARGVDGSLDSSLLTIGWLEARSVLTLGRVNLSLVVVTTVRGNFDMDIRVVVSSAVWELDVDVC